MCHIPSNALVMLIIPVLLNLHKLWMLMHVIREYFGKFIFVNYSLMIFNGINRISNANSGQNKGGGGVGWDGVVGEGWGVGRWGK